MCADVVISFSSDLTSTPESGTLNIDLLVETNGAILPGLSVQFEIIPSLLAREYH